jgi:hypothetical protein
MIKEIAAVEDGQVIDIRDAIHTLYEECHSAKFSFMYCVGMKDGKYVFIVNTVPLDQQSLNEMNKY